MKDYAELLGRILMAFIFIMAGVSKIGNYAGTQGYMDSMGVPGMLLPLVILTEVGCGLMILLGYKTEIAATLLAGFTLIAAFIFHNNMSDQMQMIMFMKNLAITGGLLFLLVHGAGRLSFDQKRNNSA